MIRAIVAWFLLIGLAGCSAQEAFFAAIRARDVEQVRAMCKSRPSLVSAEDAWGSIGLNIAVECGNVEIVRILVDAGSDLHHDSRIKGMPLHDAAYYGKRDILEMLIKAGADVNRQPEHKSSHGKGTALHNAVLGEKLEIVKILFEHGADENAKCKNHCDLTPLHRAVCLDPASQDAIEIVQLLLDHGADVNAKADAGETPLYWAKRTPSAKEFTAIIDLLIKHGAKEEGPQMRKQEQEAHSGLDKQHGGRESSIPHR